MDAYRIRLCLVTNECPYVTPFETNDSTETEPMLLLAPVAKTVILVLNSLLAGTSGPTSE